MRDLHWFDTELAHIATADRLLTDAGRRVGDELAALDAEREHRPLSKEDRKRYQELHDSRRQIETGPAMDEGIDPELDALLSRAEIARFRFRQPGLAPLRRLRDELTAEREALVATQAVVWPRPFVYVGPKRKHQMNGAFVQPGDIVELNESQAQSWADRFEPVRENAGVEADSAQPAEVPS
jgi:hypothetical protein